MAKTQLPSPLLSVILTSSVISTTLNTWIDLTETLTLPEGLWDVESQIVMGLNAASNTTIYGNAALSDSLNNHLDLALANVYHSTPNTTSGLWLTNNARVFVALGTTVTLKVRIRFATGTGSGTMNAGGISYTGAFSGTQVSPKITAKRVA